MSHDHYLALAGKIARVAETLRDEPVVPGLQELALRMDYPKYSVCCILQSLKRCACVAASVLDSWVCECGSISIGVPKVRFSPALAEDMALYPVSACRRLSGKLGETGYVHPHHGEFTLVEDTNQLFHLSKEG